MRRAERFEPLESFEAGSPRIVSNIFQQTRANRALFNSSLISESFDTEMVEMKSSLQQKSATKPRRQRFLNKTNL